MMPFGLDLKTIIITVIFMLFVLPYVRSLMLAKTAKTQTKATQ